MRNINLLLSGLIFLSGFQLSAQAPKRVTISGIIQDTLGGELAHATVMLLNPEDTTLVNFSRSDETGAFAFKNVRNAPYLFKISYIGFIPHNQSIDPSETDEIDLGIVQMKPINQQLMEVVIKTAKAPLRIRGDTIEYDATTFKVPPGSTVEDLLRKLPGIEVDADGNIKAQGRDVQRVYVDGKTFFGDDPKSATKNLGAETVSKVQVYDDKSEQAKLTGVDDGKKEKSMNLELKDEYKKGSFGKVTGAFGTEDRWAARGNYNRFNEKQQLSFIGYANNVNETGVNWDDYGEFKGQNSFNNFDNGDFGFGGNRGGRVFYFGNDDILNNFDGRGFTKNFGGGVNYNFDNKKTKANASYFYNETSLDLNETSFRESFIQNGSFFLEDTTAQMEFRGNHSLATRFEHDIDSLDKIIVKANLRFSQSNNTNVQTQFFRDIDASPTNQRLRDISGELDSWRLTSAAIYRHRFKKKGRSLAISGGYNNNQSDEAENISNSNEVFDDSFTSLQQQLNQNDNSTQQVKSSVLFTESLTKRWFFETFYNFSHTGNNVNRQVVDPEQNNVRIDSLSIYYDYRVLYNRLGAVIRYSHEGLNTSAGLAGQQIKLHGEYAIDENSPLLGDPIEKSFNNLVPYVDASYEFTNNWWLRTDYTYEVSEPSVSDLQPVPIVTNPAFQREGNPDLVPERSHDFSVNLNHWNPASFSNIGVGTNYSIFENRIIDNQTVEYVDSVGVVTYSRPENISGGYRFGMYLWSNFPIIKTKLTVNLGGNIYTSKSPAFVNGIENETSNNNYSIRCGLTLTPVKELIVSLNGSLGFNDVNYSIQESQNQDIIRHNASGSVRWQFLPKFFLESNFNYSLYRNDRFGFNQEIPIWNASIRRLLGASNRFEVRLAAFDLLNRNVNIRQYGSQNFVSQNTASTLARYFMLSLSYNVRGYEDKVKKGWW